MNTLHCLSDHGINSTGLWLGLYTTEADEGNWGEACAGAPPEAAVGSVVLKGITDPALPPRQAAATPLVSVLCQLLLCVSGSLIYIKWGEISVFSNVAFVKIHS